MTDWLAAARAAADRPPSRPREALWLRGTDAAHPIGSIEPAVAAGLASDGLPLEAAACGWCIAAPFDTSLAAIARWIDAHGFGSRWRDELLAVVDSDGRVQARVERAVVRVLGVTTFAVHLAGWAPGGAAWVQQRAFGKAVDPGMWDTLMGGQIAAGETVESALARETLEEAGLAVHDLHGLHHTGRLTLRRPVAEGYLVEHIEVFDAVVPEGVVPVNRDGEVERFERLDPVALSQRLGAGDFTLEATLVLGAALVDGARAGR